jgi:hypothetical protein
MDPQNQPLNRFQPQGKPIKFLAIIAGVAILLSVVWYAATHGYLVTSDSVNGQYTLQKDTADQTAKTTSLKKGKTTLPSGKYIIRYTDGGSDSLRYVEVPTFLRSVQATFSSSVQRHVERVALGTLSQIAASPENTITSVNDTQQIGSTFIHPHDNPTAVAKKIGRIPINSNQNFMHNNHFIGFTFATDNGKKQVQRYSFMGQKNEIIPKAYADKPTTHLITPSTAQTDLFGVSYTKDSAASIDIYNGGTLVHTLNGLQNIAVGRQNNAVVGLSEKYAAIGHGSDHTIEVDANPKVKGSGSPKASQYTVKIYNLSNSQVEHEIKLGKTLLVEAVQINDDGSYVSVIEAGKITIFDVKSGKQIFSYAAVSVLNPQWITNSELLFGTVDKGIFRLNAKERSATTLFQTSIMNLSKFDIYNNKVYLTAYSKAGNVSAGPADGYIVDLDKEATDGNQLLQVTPTQTQEFRMQSLNNIIYVVPNTSNQGGAANLYFRTVPPSDLLKQQVEAYLKSNLRNWNTYQIVYGNHF